MKNIIEWIENIAHKTNRGLCIIYKNKNGEVKMKIFTEGLLEKSSFPVLLLNSDLTFRYANEAATHRMGILCRPSGAKPFIGQKAYAEAVNVLSEHSPVVLSGAELTNFITMLLIPVRDGDEDCVMAFCEDELSIYKSVNGYSDAKALSSIFYDLESIPVEKILTLCRGMRRRFNDERVPELREYLNMIEKMGNELLQITGSMLSSMHLLTMTEKFGLSYIDLNEFFARYRSVNKNLDTSEVSRINYKIPFGSDGLTRLFDLICEFLASVGKGRVKVFSSVNGSHVILKFTCERNAEKFNAVDAFEANTENNSLFFARRIVEHSGGNIMVQKERKDVSVIVSMRIFTPVNYEFYLAQKEDDLSSSYR